MDPPAPRRLLTLDVFRGITIAGMILVNSPGNDDAYPALQHAAWHGWTPTDFVFPSLLLIMGASLAISLGRRLEKGESAARLLPQIFWRAALIFALGLVMSFVMDPSLIMLRVLGVLQRIALCYLLCAALFLGTTPTAQAVCATGLLVGYWLLMTLVPVPGVGPGVLTPEGNLASYLDRLALDGHLYQNHFDPEGLLSTLPAAATTLFGVLAGQWLRSHRRHARKAAGLAAAGAAAAALGRLWGIWFPINKHIWTSSYALFTGGLALLGLALCYWLIEVKEIRGWARPFEIFGRNPLLSYFLSGLFYGIQEFIALSGNGNLKLWLCDHLFGWLSRPNASLAYAACYTFACLALMSVFYRKKVFVRI